MCSVRATIRIFHMTGATAPAPVAQVDLAIEVKRPLEEGISLAVGLSVAGRASPRVVHVGRGPVAISAAHGARLVPGRARTSATVIVAIHRARFRAGLVAGSGGNTRRIEADLDLSVAVIPGEHRGAGKLVATGANQPSDLPFEGKMRGVGAALRALLVARRAIEHALLVAARARGSPRRREPHPVGLRLHTVMAKAAGLRVVLVEHRSPAARTQVSGVKICGFGVRDPERVHAVP